MRRCVTAKRRAAAIVAACVFVAAPCSAQTMPAWAADPAIPGPTLPPAGRSLFDFVAADGVPFPFEALVQKVEARAGCKPGTCVDAVLIPLGRSLQRTAPAPDFFAFPRAVVAVTREGTGPLRARDRVYLGYQEKANVVEVISYNEAAARFEFQIVRDYRAGGSPRVSYANRNVCIACHQNHAPIFSRQVWDETNANPRIAARLVATGRPYYGVTVQRGVDIPNAIDDAIHRANRISVTQRIWREACDAACRAAALTAALQYRLSGERAFDVPGLTGALSRAFAARWPAGLAIPNPELPNREPLAVPAGTGGIALSQVGAGLEALAPRAPLETWTADDPLLARRFVVSLAELVADSDVQDLDAALRRRGAAARRHTYTAICSVAGERYTCAGEVALRGSATTIDALSFGGEPMGNYVLRNGVVTSRGLRARTPRGDAIERVAVRRAGASGSATVTVIEDFEPVHAALAILARDDAPLGRTRMRAALGLDVRAACCEDATALDAPQEDAEPESLPSAAATAFQTHCARCHRTTERFPPNFLSGDAGRVDAMLAQCAPRIYVRLAMWQAPPVARDKVPMPPPRASRDGSPWIQTEPDPAIASLRGTVAGWLRAETGVAPDAAAMLAPGYENLRPCLLPGP